MTVQGTTTTRTGPDRRCRTVTTGYTRGRVGNSPQWIITPRSTSGFLPLSSLCVAPVFRNSLHPDRDGLRRSAFRPCVRSEPALLWVSAYRKEDPAEGWSRVDSSRVSFPSTVLGVRVHRRPTTHGSSGDPPTLPLSVPVRHRTLDLSETHRGVGWEEDGKSSHLRPLAGLRGLPFTVRRRLDPAVLHRRQRRQSLRTLDKGPGFHSLRPEYGEPGPET